MKIKIPSIGECRKTLAAVGAAATTALAAGLITGKEEVWVIGLITTLTTGLTVFAAPANAVPEPLPEAPELHPPAG